MMRIGFYTPYRQREVTWLTLQLAEYCQRYGAVSVRTDDPVRPLSPAWDQRVAQTSKLKFTDWVERHDYVMWSFPGSAAQVKWVGAHNCIPYALVTSADWQNRRHRARAKLHSYDTVFCQNNMLLTLQKWMPKAALSPMRWAPLIPVTRRLPDTANLTVVVPLVHGALEYLAPHFWHVLHVLMQQHRTVRVVVLTDMDHARVQHKLSGVSTLYADRLSVVQTLTPDSVIAQMQRASIVWLPTVARDVGLLALWSLYSGAPPLVFDAPPYSHIVQHDQTGWTVSDDYPAMVAAGSENFPVYARMVEQLLALLHRPQRIRDVCTRLSDGLQDRRAVFNKVWDAAFRVRKTG